MLHAFCKRCKIKVFNASLGVLGTQEKYVSLILFGFNLREVQSGSNQSRR